MADQIQIVDRPSAKEVSNAATPLLHIKTAFPFDLFQDEIVLDRFKIDIIKRDFIAMERVISIPLSKSLTIKLNKGPFFANIEIDDPEIAPAVTRIKYLWAKDALLFRQIVLGMVVGMRQGIDIMHMEDNELITSSMNWGSVGVS